MALSFRRDSEPAEIEALVIADDIDAFDELAHDLDLEFGAGQWELLAMEDASEVFGGSTSAEFVIIAVSSENEASIERMAELIRHATENGLFVVLVVGEISNRIMHRLFREGAREFAPYPDTEGAFPDAVNRLRLARSHNTEPGLPVPVRSGKVIGVYGAAGGVGATTFAVNLAWEVAVGSRKQGRRVALLDFNFQYGAVATYLDVPRREAVYELVSDASNLDQTGLMQALSTYKDRLHVLTAPRDALPLDIVSPSDVASIVKLAQDAFDYVIIDMPQALMNWSEQVYVASDVFYALMEIDMRSAQNMFRFIRTLKSEDMSLDKLRFVLNRAPGMTDLGGKGRVRRVADSLGLTFNHLLPDGGKQVVNACDQGVPLMEAAKSNPLRKEIAKAAESVLTETAKPAKTASAG